jgi:predicted Zn finger-like uncharacterized protein
MGYRETTYSRLDGSIMPIIVSCPNCSGQLRVADDLIGRKVRCPACSTTFEAASAPAPKPLPAESEKVDAWKFLDLELKADPPPLRPSPPPRPTLELDEEIPTAPRDPSLPRRDGPRPQLNDDHDDMFPCKVCGRMCHNDARRCSHCGERFDGDGDEDAPRRRRPRRDDRRDTEPHRAGFVLAMGIVSLSLLLVCWPLSIIFGMIAWISGGSDLRKMRADTMDPEGEGSTQAGWICGIIGTCLSAVVYLGCGTIVGISWYETIQSSRRMNPPRIVAPPRQVPGQGQKF